MSWQENALARAERGAAFLDAVRPEWAWEVDPLRLNVASCIACVWGQILDVGSGDGGGWVRLVQWLAGDGNSLDSDEGRRACEWGRVHGWAMGNETAAITEALYLTDAWRALIAARRVTAFHVGQLVCYRATFLRSVGWYTDVPRNGRIEALLPMGDDLLVAWCDGRTVPVNPANLIAQDRLHLEVA